MEVCEWARRHGVADAALAELLDLLERPAMVAPQPAAPGTESKVAADIRLAAPYFRVLLWRNNVGVLPDSRGVPVRFGLCNDSKRVNERVKSADLIGLTRGGRFLAVETKAPGWTYTGKPREAAQLRFLNLVNAKGGVGLFATSVEDVERALGDGASTL